MKRSTRFLVASATGAAATANALRPYARSGKLSVASFVCGLPTSELPLQTLILQAAGAALLARKGGCRGVSGAIGVAATAGSLAGLARLHGEAVRAADVLEAALTDQLGSDYRRRIRANFIAAPEVPLDAPADPPARLDGATPVPRPNATFPTVSSAGVTCSTSGGAETSPPTPARLCWCRSTGAPGRAVARKARVSL